MSTVPSLSRPMTEEEEAAECRTRRAGQACPQPFAHFKPNKMRIVMMIAGVLGVMTTTLTGTDVTWTESREHRAIESPEGARTAPRKSYRERRAWA